MIETRTYYGFNFLWMFRLGNKDRVSPGEIVIAENEIDFIAKMGCNFIRLPLDYQLWVENFKYDEPNEAMLKKVDDCVHAVISRGLHCSLNIHRAPGYCINGADQEKHNLWKDEEAQTAFVEQWRHFAERYASVPRSALSFDLLNEPPNIGQYGMTREIHARLMRTVASAIRTITFDRPITLDGLCGGNEAIPELSDLGVTMSTRGYQPMPLTHYRAAWCEDTKNTPYPVYPGTVYDGKKWNSDTLIDHYKPWKNLADSGIQIHVGEFGCYNKVDNALALRWFRDILSLFKEYGWGYSLWNLIGDFGIIGHGRIGTRWKKKNGFVVDRDLYELFLEYMLED